MAYASPREVKWEHRLQRLGFVCFVGVTGAAVLGLLGDRARIVANTSGIYLLLLVIFQNCRPADAVGDLDLRSRAAC